MVICEGYIKMKMLHFNRTDSLTSLVARELTAVMFSQTRTRQCVGSYMCMVMVAIVLSSGMAKKANKDPPAVLGPYEWFRPGGLTKGWEFNPEVDENLINQHPQEGTLFKVIRAYERARDKIERKLDDLTAKLKKKKLGEYIPAANYQVLRMDAIIVRDDNGNLRRRAFPVEMKASVDVFKTANQVDRYEVLIDLDSPFDGYNGEGPHGPHVGYEIKKDRFSLAGHLLIDANRRKHQNNPCPRLLPDRHSIEKNARAPNPNEVPWISPKCVLNGVEEFQNGKNLNLWRVPMVEGGKDTHFTSNFYLDSCKHYMDEQADKPFIPKVVTFKNPNLTNCN